jgi:hypothetical protein
MKNSDVIFHLVEKYGKTDPEMSKRYNVSPETKYIRLYDNPSCGSDRIDMLAFDPQQPEKSRKLSRTWFYDLGPSSSLYTCESYCLDAPADSQDSRYNGQAVLLSAINTLLSDKQICSSSDRDTYGQEVNFVKSIASICSRRLKSERSKSFHMNHKVGQEIFDRISDSIKKVIRDKYNGHLDLPVPISLLEGGRGIEENSMFVSFSSIDANHALNFYTTGGWSDMVTNEGYGIRFINQLNDFIGGKEQFRFGETLGGRFYLESPISSQNVENITKEQALKVLLDSDAQIPLDGEQYTDYFYKRIRSSGQNEGEAKGGIIAEYRIGNPYEGPLLKKWIGYREAIELCELSNIDLVDMIKERNKKDIERNKERFTKAFEELMPSLYEQTIQKGVKIENFDSLLEWYNNKQKIENSLSKIGERKTELSERTGEKVSSPAEPTTHDSNSPTPSKPNGRDDGGYDGR